MQKQPTPQQALAGVRTVLARVRRTAWHARRRLLTTPAARRTPPHGPASVSGRPGLDEIGLAHGTDKSSAGHGFLEVYERVLGHLRDESFQLLEIGVHKGASLRTWATYFSRAEVVGVDRDPATQQVDVGRATVRLGDQSSPATLHRLAADLRPLVVVDDGSHVWRHQVATLRALWPAVRAGGYYVVEDIHTSFGDRYATTYGRGATETAYDYVAGLVRGAVAGPSLADPPRDAFEFYFRQTVDHAVFLRHSVVLRKRDNEQARWWVAGVADVAPDARPADLGGSYERVDGELVDASPEVRAAFEALRAERVVPPPRATASAALADVTVLGHGLALTPDGHLLRESTNCVRNVGRGSDMYAISRDRLWVNEVPLRPRRVPREPGLHHVLLKHAWDSNYGHWLVDSLPRLALLEPGWSPAECVAVVNPQRDDAMRQVVLDSLALAGVGPDRVRFLDGHLQFEELVVLGSVSDHPTYKSPASIRWLERLGEQVEPGGDERVYVSRSLSARRRLLNEPEVEAVLQEAGYRVLRPERMDLREQVAAFRGARHVVGAMGAGLASTVFSPPGVKVLALATETMRHDFFYDIVCHKSGGYRGLQGAAQVAPGSPADNGSDFTVDLGHLAEQLEWLHR